jgi:hypothetical protein
MYLGRKIVKMEGKCHDDSVTEGKHIEVVMGEESVLWAHSLAVRTLCLHNIGQISTCYHTQQM